MNRREKRQVQAAGIDLAYLDSLIKKETKLIFDKSFELMDIHLYNSLRENRISDERAKKIMADFQEKIMKAKDAE